MKDFSTKRKIAVSVIIILIALTIGFIWGNSTMPKEASNEESETVSSTLQTVVDAVLGEDVISVENGAVRKTAHATEFAVLGAEFCLLLIALKKGSYKNYLKVLPCGLFVAAVDEGIQVVSDRGPMLTDVLIDFCGFLVMTAVFLAIYAIRAKVKAKKQL